MAEAYRKSEKANSSDLSGMTDEKQLVVFRLSEEEFGLEIDNVKEIVRLPAITPVPRSPAYIAGICNLRGNVLPVIDTRTRFSMDSQKPTDHTRLLVVEEGGAPISLIVDSVREVMRMTDVQEEPPPAVCRGIDRQFLSGVVKADEGSRLILKLNLGQVLTTDLQTEDAVSQSQARQTEIPSDVGEETISEEQLVSFNIAGDEYAFDIAKVSEIIKVTDITAVPNVPNYVRGLFTIRNHLLPILDLREMLGLPSLVSERHKVIDRAVAEHRSWSENLHHVLEAGLHFTGSVSAKDSAFGNWLESYKTSGIEVEAIIKRLKKNRWELYASAAEALRLRKGSKEAAMSLFNEMTLPLVKIVIDILAEFKEAMDRYILEDQRALVVASDGITIGYLVDWVDEVIRIPRSVIDETPAMASSDRREIKGVAKLDKGERLIMIMDESALVSHETSRVLSDHIRKKKDEKGADEGEKKLSRQLMDEEQLVTFTINKEEYGIRIMQVQEINRIADITAVPRAPYFVDGMTNLRGNVIPVINIRKLFDLEEVPIDDRTRIIIVDIGGNKTGLRVDQVNEVLRLSRRDIEKTPRIVISGNVNRYMEGVCKINGGKRMVVLLNVEKILDENELRRLGEIVKKPENDREDMPSEGEYVPEPEPEKRRKLEIAE